MQAAFTGSARRREDRFGISSTAFAAVVFQRGDFGYNPKIRDASPLSSALFISDQLLRRSMDLDRDLLIQKGIGVNENIHG